MKEKIHLYRHAWLVGFALLLLFCCEKDSLKNTEVKKISQKRDLKEIKASGTLRALTVYSGTTYYLYKGRPMGYEFELLERLAKYLDVTLEMVVVNNVNELFEKLNNGGSFVLNQASFSTKKT
jgi:membrane-bound lytic murein transglycosylase F